MATLAGISEQTVRNFTRTYAELLSPAGRGEMGARAFSDEDTQVLLSVATMRRAGVPPAEIIERIRRGDVYIEPQQTTTHEPQATPSHTEAQHAPLAAIEVQSMLDAYVDALQREKGRVLWSHGVAFYLGMVTMGVIFLLVWWLVNG
jgi:DNA-binding transcriptional MerR regulator